jgi:DNA polymerase III alpha subunit
MAWYEQFKSIRTGDGPRQGKSGAKPVRCVSDIPLDATPRDAFRIAVAVVEIAERPTKKGDPCYFLNVRDGCKINFSIVVWQSQWAKLRGEVAEGASATLDVRVPAEGFLSFTLA